MAIQLMGLPQLRIQEQGLDAAPLTRAIQGYTAGSDAATQFANTKAVGQTAATGDLKAAARQAMGLGETDLGMQYQQRATQDEATIKKRLGSMAQAVEMEADPNRRNAMWQRVLKMVPGGATNLAPEEMDPMTGPKMLMAEAGIVVDPLERQTAQAKLGLIRAQTAQANQRAPHAPDVKEFYDGNGGKYMGQWNGREWVRVGGSSEPKLTPAQTAVDKAFGKTYEEDFASGGVADQTKNLDQLRAVRNQLRGVQVDPKTGVETPMAEKPNLTGPVLGAVPDFIKAFTNPKAVDTRERVEEVVQRNLRVILGAQFTNEEGKRLIARAYNPSLDEKTNADRLDNLIKAMDSALASKRKAAQYFEQHGTLKGYNGATRFSLSDFENAIDGGGGSSPAANPLKQKYGLE